MTFLVTLFLFLGVADAANFECEKSVVSDIIRTKVFKNWSQLKISRTVHPCYGSGPCVEEPHSYSIIADYSQVCSTKLVVSRKCTVTEGLDWLKVNCLSGDLVLHFSMDEESNGQIVCTREGEEFAVYNVGQCEKVK